MSHVFHARNCQGLVPLDLAWSDEMKKVFSQYSASSSVQFSASSGVQVSPNAIVSPHVSALITHCLVHVFVHSNYIGALLL